MKLSVIIPNYNSEKFLNKCLDSVVNQTYKDFEIIIIDDGSTDKSVEIIKEYKNNSNCNITLIEQFNQNAAIARNKGISIAKGEYVYFLDSDDELYSNQTFEMMINKIENYDLLIGNFIIVNEKGDYIKDYKNSEDFLEYDGNYKYCKISPNPSNKLYKMEVIKNNELYFSNVRIGQDLNFYLKYLSVCKEIKLINDMIYKYRDVSTGMSNSTNLRFLDIQENFNEIRKFYKKNNMYENYQKYITTVALSNYHGQLTKVSKFKDKYAKKVIYDFFKYSIKQNDKEKKANPIYSKEYKKYIVKKFLLKTNLFKYVKKLKSVEYRKYAEKFDLLITNILSRIDIKLASKYFYKKRVKKELNLENPASFNEKLMWLKINIYQDNPVIWECVDKYTVRKYLKEKMVSEKNLPKVIDVYDSVEEINYEKLPNKFALKCTHGCGFNIICDDKEKLDINKTNKKLNKWLNKKFGYNTAELQYIHKKPKIICEKFIESNNSGFPWDYKIYCFNGKPKVVLVCTNRENGYKTHFYDDNWNVLTLRDDQSRDEIEKPKSFGEMLEISKKISKDFPFIRIDFYEENRTPIIGELTFTPSSCTAIYNDFGDKYLGELLDISDLIKKYGGEK